MHNYYRPGTRNPYSAIRTDWETWPVPETRLERVFATIGLLTIAGLTVLVVVGYLDYRQQASASSGGRAAPTGVLAASRGESRAGAPATAPGRSAALSAASTLVVTAARGDCWLEVHAGAADGDVLYEGILAKGDARTFRGKALWIRAGAAEKLEMTLNGRLVDNVPRGTADVLVTSRGVRPATS